MAWYSLNLTVTNEWGDVKDCGKCAIKKRG